MIENDTIRLLRECDAGAKMGIDSLNDMMGKAKSTDFKNILNESKKEHEEIEHKIQEELIAFEDGGKDPGAMAKGMSWLKTNIKMGIDDSDSTLAELLTDGCNMGIQSLNSYLNKYVAADESSKNLTKKLIHAEQSLVEAVSSYL